MKWFIAMLLGALVLLVYTTASRAAVFNVHASDGFMNIRTGPGTNHGLVGTVPSGATVESNRCVPRDDGIAGANWCYVVFGRVSGWVSQAGLLPVPVAPPPPPAPTWVPPVHEVVESFSCVPTPDAGDRNPPVTAFVSVTVVRGQPQSIAVYYDLANGERVYRSRQYNAVTVPVGAGETGYGWKGTYVRDPSKTMAGAIVNDPNSGDWFYREKQWDRGFPQYDHTMPCTPID